MAAVIITKGREKSILRQHPWVFSGAIKRMDGDPQPGEIVKVLTQEGNFLAQGYWNPKSQIAVRLLSWSEEVNDDWWKTQLRRAFQSRMEQGKLTEARRLVNAENDYLPGLIIDRYGAWLVLQALTLGIDQRKLQLAEMAVEVLEELDIKIHGIFERSDVDVRKKEGLQLHSGVLWGEAPPETIRTPLIAESQAEIWVDVRQGHKTGYYLDQRENWHVVSEYVRRCIDETRECRVLNLFSYTGGFSSVALANGATQVVNVDRSREALVLSEQMHEVNQHFGGTANAVEFIQADVFEFLRDQANQGAEYDLVILDPPKFAHTQQQVEKASRGYKDINLNALRLVRSGGFLFTFSCSGAISRDLFQKIVFGALNDSDRQAQILRNLGAADDHPIALTFPEGEYLKGFVLRVY
jgi:23S rRNA (cytosine1962-C5)-methyltransferase